MRIEAGLLDIVDTWPLKVGYCSVRAVAAEDCRVCLGTVDASSRLVTASMFGTYQD